MFCYEGLGDNKSCCQWGVFIGRNVWYDYPYPISFLVGAVLGLNFKVGMLVPATGLALILVALNGIVAKEGISQLVGAMTLVSTFLQLGCIGGSILQFATSRVMDH